MLYSLKNHVRYTLSCVAVSVVLSSGAYAAESDSDRERLGATASSASHYVKKPFTRVSFPLAGEEKESTQNLRTFMAQLSFPPDKEGLALITKAQSTVSPLLEKYKKFSHSSSVSSPTTPASSPSREELTTTILETLKEFQQNISRHFGLTTTALGNWHLSETYYTQANSALQAQQKFYEEGLNRFQKGSSLYDSFEKLAAFCGASLESLTRHLEFLRGDTSLFTQGTRISLKTGYYLNEDKSELTFLTVTPFNFGLYQAALSFLENTYRELKLLAADQSLLETEKASFYNPPLYGQLYFLLSKEPSVSKS